MSDGIEVRGGYMYGRWRQPINIWSGSKESIHNDDTAHRVGMRGGTIPGTIHLNLFPPLLLKAFGERWFERGTLSMYYTYATTDRESTRAVMGIPPAGAKDAQVELWVEMPDGHTVAKGTASVGDCKEPTYLQTTELKNAKPEEIRILAGFRAGEALPSRDIVVTQETVNKALKTITEELDWYKGKSPWGGTILPPAEMYEAMMLTSDLPGGHPQGVGFFGATEIRNVNGPIKVGVKYHAHGKLICVGASAKTEFFWYDAYLDEKATGRRVAEMRKLTRFMKAGSPLYQ